MVEAVISCGGQGLSEESSWCSTSVNGYHVGMQTRIARSTDFPGQGRHPNFHMIAQLFR
jgi:hypothetical protein